LPRAFSRKACLRKLKILPALRFSIYSPEVPSQALRPQDFDPGAASKYYLQVSGPEISALELRRRKFNASTFQRFWISMLRNFNTPEQSNQRGRALHQAATARAIGTTWGLRWGVPGRAIILGKRGLCQSTKKRRGWVVRPSFML
jgi:hypothetical protein